MIRGNLLLKLGLGAVLGLISSALFSMTTTTKNDGDNVRQNKILRSSSSPPPVKVQVYTEALCNGCQMFMLESLIPAYRKLAGDDGKNDVMDLTWIPFGNSDLVRPITPFPVSMETPNAMLISGNNVQRTCTGMIQQFI